jgi:DNA-binding CsgD family transcriptional regulator
MALQLNARAVARGGKATPDRSDAVVASRPQRRLPPSRLPAFQGCVLSACELQTLRQMARGLTYAEAARETRRAPSTVRSHLHTAYKRLGVTTISQALAMCTYIDWLDAVACDGAAVELADRRVTWAQCLYLEAFDQSLRASEDPDEVERTQLLRRAALEGMYREAGQQPPPWRPTATDPLGRIVRTLQRL